MDDMNSQNSLIVLVGPSAIGKTYLSRRLLELFGHRLGLVKNTTSRRPRSTEDLEYYHFVSREDFERGIAEGRFIEHDQYLGNYYGSSMTSIMDILNSRNGILSVTPPGAVALYGRRFEVNLLIVLLKPADEGVLLTNLLRRNVTDPAEQARLIAESGKFRLPQEVKHKTIMITGTHADERQLILAVESDLRPR